MFRFESLEVWKKSVQLANLMITISDDFPVRYQSSFGDQLRRAGLSIPNNIAEGNGRKTDKESNNFYNIAKGSVYECINMLIIADTRGMIDWKKYNRGEIYTLAEDIAKMLHGLMN